MSLFNFIALSLSRSEYLERIHDQELVFYQNTLNIKHKLLHVKSQLATQVKQNPSHNKQLYIATESIYRFSKLHNFNPFLLQELINQYWRQKIFFSISNPTVQKYINQLSKQETLIEKNKKKKILLDFSKALLYGHIDTYSFNFKNTEDLNKTCSVQYTWKKGLNFSGPKSFNGLWINKRMPNFPNKNQSSLLKKLEGNHFPVFTVVNGFKQLIVAEPSDKLVNRNHLVNSLYEWYYDRFLWSKDLGGVYEGWFFINPRDAEEYKTYIANKYARSTKHHGLGIALSSIDFFYRLNRTAPPRTEFRLFPDLEEVANLLNKRHYKSNIVFDKNQKYGRSYFQGQPIYIIDPVRCNRKNSTKTTVLNYSYQIPQDKTRTEYNAIFLSKDIALQAWQKFCLNHTEYNLPVQPILRVYNLEDFLKDYETQNISNKSQFLLIPGEDSYRYIESKYANHNTMNSYERMNQYSNSYWLTGKLWVQRIIWSLTSRQPPNW